MQKLLYAASVAGASAIVYTNGVNSNDQPVVSANLCYIKVAGSGESRAEVCANATHIVNTTGSQKGCVWIADQPNAAANAALGAHTTAGDLQVN